MSAVIYSQKVSGSELTDKKPGWPYQAILSATGGRVIIVQTQTPGSEHAKKLSNLLVEGFMRFCMRKDDDSSLAAVNAYLEEQRRRQQN